MIKNEKKKKKVKRQFIEGKRRKEKGEEKPEHVKHLLLSMNSCFSPLSKGKKMDLKSDTEFKKKGKTNQKILASLDIAYTVW